MGTIHKTSEVLKRFLYLLLYKRLLCDIIFIRL
nr:MAG TPA: hypothetical protein [Siphoviridae sp. ctX8T1]